MTLNEENNYNLVHIRDLHKCDKNNVIDALMYIIESYLTSVKQSRIGEVAFIGSICIHTCVYFVEKVF